MKKSIAIVGGGSCALMLGCELDSRKFDVSLYEKNAALGRKFLVAGEGGLNLTHSENETAFISRYTPSGFLKEAFSHFSNRHTIAWMNALRVPTYTGSSGRIFPERGIKPVEVLNAILARLKSNGVAIHTKYNWQGFAPNGALLFEHNTLQEEKHHDIVIFCLGGASWPVTGSTGKWADPFLQKNISVKAFRASNCSFIIDWEASLVPKIEGKILKNISISCGDKDHTGEVVLTRTGLEGSGIYPLSPAIREQLDNKSYAELVIDLKPGILPATLLTRLKARPAKVNITQYLKTVLNVSDVQLLLLKQFISREDFLSEEKLAQHIKAFKLIIRDTGPVEDAISTVGGIALDEIHGHFELKKMPGHFAIGEMLDYDAPTGGYLLQSCFSMGKYLAGFLNQNAVNY